MTGKRSLLAVKDRGQWQSDNSLKRYGKETRVLEELRKMPHATLEYGKQVSDRLGEVFNGLALVPPSLESMNQPAPKAKVSRKRKSSVA